MPEIDMYLRLLHQLSDMGAAMRNVITKAVTDPLLYKKFTEGRSDTGVHSFDIVRDVLNI